MKRLFLSIFILAVLALPVGAWAGTTCYADGTLASDCTSGNYSIAARDCSGADGNAYNTIQEAVTASADDNADIVMVRAGTYTEAVTIGGATSLRNFTLKNYTGEAPIIQGSDTVPAGGQYAPLIYVNGSVTGVYATGVTVDGFIVRRSRGYGIQYKGQRADIGTIKNCTIYENYGVGLLVQGYADDITIEDCVIYKNAMCIVGGYSGNLTVCTGGTRPSQVSLGADHGNNILMRRCTVRDSYHEGLNIERYSSNVTVEQCAVYGNPQLQIYAVNTTYPTIRHNLIYGTATNANGVTGQGAGIWFGNEAQWAQTSVDMQGKAYGNLIANVSRGIWIGGGSSTLINNVDVYGNTIVESTYYGFSVEPTTGTGHNFKNNILLQAAGTPVYIPSSRVTGGYNLYDRAQADIDDDVEGAGDIYTGDAVLTKTSDWATIAGGDLTGAEFAIGATSGAYNTGVEASDYALGIQTTGTDFTASPITVATVSHYDYPSTSVAFDIGAWVYTGEEVPPIPPAAGCATCTFWWDCEAADFSASDGTTNYSAGDNTAALNNATISDAAEKIGTYGLSINGNYGGAAFDALNIISDTAGRYGAWYYLTTWGTADVDSLFTFKYSINANNYLTLRCDGTDEIELVWRDNGSAAVTLTTAAANIPSGGSAAWVFIEARWDVATDLLEILVNGVSKASTTASALNEWSNDPNTFGVGNGSGTTLRGYVDQVRVSSDITTDLYAIADETTYLAADATDPTVAAIGVWDGDSCEQNVTDTWGAETVTICMELPEDVIVTDSNVVWTMTVGPTATYTLTGSYLRETLDGATTVLLMDFTFASPMRISHPQMGTASGGTIVDGSDNAIDFTGSAGDLDGTGTINIEVAASLPFFVGGDDGTWETMADFYTDVGYGNLPGDYLTVDTFSGVLNALGDGTALAPITVTLADSDTVATGAWTLDEDYWTINGAGGKIVGDVSVTGTDVILSRVRHNSTVTLGVDSLHHNSLIPTGDALVIPEGATGVAVYNSTIAGTLTVAETCALLKNLIVVAVDLSGVGAGETVTFTSCVFTQSQATIEATLGDGAVVFTACAFSKSVASLFVNAGGGNYQLLKGSAAIDAGVDLGVGYQLDIAGVIRPVGDVWDVGAYEASLWRRILMKFFSLGLY